MADTKASGIVPNAGYITFGDNFSLFTNVILNGPSRAFGGGGGGPSTSSSGEHFAMDSTNLLLPTGYTSKTPISGSMTFSGSSFAGLGVTPTPFSFATLGGSNTIYMFTDSPRLPDSGVSRN